jgi:hypothetical protein
MKKVLMFTLCSLLFSLLSYGCEVIEGSTETSSDLSTTIQSFYRAYISNLSDDHKTDSILSKYCTTELKDFVQETLSIDGYDFVLDGWGGEIKLESVSVIKQNDKYKVSFKASLYPISNELATDSLYILVNQEKKISYIIRPSDNYMIPHQD